MGVLWSPEDYTFKLHAEHIRKKTLKKFNAVNGLINGYSRLSPRLKIDIIYKQLIRPCMEYAQQVLIYDSDDIRKFEDLQCSMLKKCLGFDKCSYANHVIRIVSNIPKLSDRWNNIKKQKCFQMSKF